MPDPRRATPRTDHVLADERLQAAATRLGPVLVKHAVTAALERCRAGELDPAAVADAAVAALPAARRKRAAVVGINARISRPWVWERRREEREASPAAWRRRSRAGGRRSPAGRR